MTTCAACGFCYEDLPVSEIAESLRGLGIRYRAALSGRPAARLRRRPAPDVWSPLEYACHVRDVLLVQRDRVVRALVEDAPAFSPMHRDERVTLAGYAEEEPADVLDQLAMAADLLARLYRRLSAGQLARSCRYRYPEPAARDLAWVGRHTVHEGEHHLGDVQAGLAFG